jgi:hypothetical protein
MSPHHKGGAKTMSADTRQSVGIDFSEDFLDVYLTRRGRRCGFRTATGGPRP